MDVPENPKVVDYKQAKKRAETMLKQPEKPRISKSFKEKTKELGNLRKD